MPQPIEEIEKHYEIKDPWQYQTTPDDLKRKQIILDTLKEYAPFLVALDLGAGEGWITKDLPARSLFGYEISKKARARMPKEVTPLPNLPDLNIKFDLVLATGVLYSHYEYGFFLNALRRYSSNIILTCNILEWEREELRHPSFARDWLNAKEILSKEFPYRQYTQKLRLFKVNT